MSGGLAALRLIEERKSFRKDHPPGFFARPCIKSDGSTNIMEWVAGITGPEGSDWEGGLFTLKMVFGSDYPVVPPSISFSPPIFHPNVFASGAICLSILKQEDGWRPAVTIKQILLAIQDLLINANEHSPANCEAATLMLFLVDPRTGGLVHTPNKETLEKQRVVEDSASTYFSRVYLKDNDNDLVD